MKRFDLIWKTETCHANRIYKNCFAPLIRLQRHTQYGNGNNVMAGGGCNVNRWRWTSPQRSAGGGANFI